MAITLEDVKVWLVDQNVGHIVLRRDGYWSYCACRLTTGGKIVKKRPTRLCKKCREHMKDLNVSKPSTGEG